MRRIEVERIVAAPPSVVFERYTDHVGWSRWAGVGKVSLVQEGSPDRNGVGCVRSFASAPGLHEEVVEFDPPNRMVYRIVRGGFPVQDHRGEVRFEPHVRGTRVSWSVEFGSRLPFTEGVIARLLQLLFGTLLARFDRREMDRH
jgi:uncharacterized protein YndB with AHSA1/START domain